MAEKPDGPAAASGEDPATAAAPSGTPAPPRRFARRHWGKLTILGLIGIPLVAVGLWAAVAMSYTYSTGTRTGYVQKLSRKGWVCKTWEGEIAMATAPGVSPQIFTFTMRNDSLAQALSLDMGKGRVAVEYDEHRGLPTSCFGDTPYFVTAYRLVTEGGAPPPP
jgi:hypothetical protein